MTTTNQHRSRTEEVLVCALLFLVCLFLARFTHEAWFMGFGPASVHASTTGAPGTLDVRGLYDTEYAPAAYRMLMPAIVIFLVGTFHLGNLPMILASIDLLSSFGALYFLYQILIHGLPQQSRLIRWLAIALFLAIIQLPINWVIPWMRIETLPTALLLAFALYCLTQTERNTLWYLPFLLALGLQSFARSDAPFIFALSLLLLSLFSSTTEGIGPRRLNILFGLLATGLAGGIQLYIQKVLYPGRVYPPRVSPIQIHTNLVLHNFSSLSLALLPFLAFVVVLFLKRPHLDAVDRLVLLSSGLYLPLWFTFGIVGEVRIYVPYLFLLSMIAAKILAKQLEEAASPSFIPTSRAE